MLPNSNDKFKLEILKVFSKTYRFSSIHEHLDKESCIKYALEWNKTKQIQYQILIFENIIQCRLHVQCKIYDDLFVLAPELLLP